MDSYPGCAAVTEPISAVKTTYLPVSHDLLVDSDLYGQHTCDESCPPPYVLPPVPPLTRMRYFLRRRWWAVKRIPGYRLVHKDDIRGEWD